MKNSKPNIIGVTIGFIIGTAVGLALNSIPIGIGIGIVFSTGYIVKNKE